MSVNKILRGGNAHYEQIDGDAAVALTPGELVEADGSASTTFQPHSTADGAASAHFVRARMGLGETINDDVPAGEYCRTGLCAPGVKVYPFLAAGETVSPGTFLVSNGDGSLKAYSAQTVDEGGTAVYDIHDRQVVAVATEALDLAGVADRARINAMVV